MYFIYYFCRITYSEDLVPGFDNFHGYSVSWVLVNNFMTLIAFFKLCSYLRLWAEFAKLVIMLTRVSQELIPFIVFLMMLVLQLAYMFHLSGVSVDREKQLSFKVEGTSGKVE